MNAELDMSDADAAEAVPLHAVEEGTGSPVLLLHGFPEHHRAWRHQLPLLAAGGRRAIAPDLRGYGASPAPRGVRPYHPRLLVADVAELVRTRCGARAVVVGHDWGGVIAWLLAGLHPELVSRLVVLNAPHPYAYAREVRRMGQALRSWYAGFFQLPLLPEQALRAGNHRLLRRIFSEGPARRDAFDAAEVERCIAALRGHRLTAALNYYRAAARFRDRELIRTTRRITVPTRVVWGMRDRYLSSALLDGLISWVPDLSIVRLEQATHWLQHDEPERVAELILGFS